MQRKITMAKALGAGIVLLAQLLGCAEGARRVRQYTYPPEFRFITREELTGAMQQLAFHMHQLHYLMRASETIEQNRGEMLAHLIGMDQAAARLDTSGWPTNHPLIDMNLADFRRDVRLARQAIEREPPNYLFAGTLAGACVYCHGGR